jgi:hypothetical protein
MAGPATTDTNAGTHIIWYGNFAYYTPNNYCGTDLENLMADTWDAHGYVQQTVMLNNINWSAYRYGIQMFMQNNNPVTGLRDYFENNTGFNNNTSNIGGNGGMNFQNDNSAAMFMTILSNISVSTNAAGCAALVGGAQGPGSLANVTAGTAGNENVFYAAGGGNSACAFNGFSFGANNFLVNPVFTNTGDLLSNRSGPPNCAGFTNTTACMGWNANTSVVTTPSVISDLTPTCSQCTGKGYQKPSTTCVTSGPIATLYPAWLKGIVYLHWNGTSLTENADLVTKPCGM